MIRRPVWKTLNADVYTAAINKNLFCRLRTYSKPEFGIVPMECLEMPVFDEFFILNPSSYDGSFVQAPDINILPTVAAEEENTPDDYTNSSFFVSDPPLDEQVQIEQGSVVTSDSGMDPGNPVNLIAAGLIPGFLGGAAGGVDVGTGAGFGEGNFGDIIGGPLGNVGVGGFGSGGALGGAGAGQQGPKGGPLGGGGEWMEQISAGDL